jgi:hypothetical protein
MSQVTEEELQKVKDGRDKVSMLAEYVSELVLQQTVLDNLVKNAKQEFLDSVSDEESYFAELNEKYGEGLLDIETGEIKTS